MTKCHLIVLPLPSFLSLSRPCLFFRITWEFLKGISVPGHSLNHLNQNLWRWIPDISLLKFLRWFLCAARVKVSAMVGLKHLQKFQITRISTTSWKWKDIPILSLLWGFSIEHCVSAQNKGFENSYVIMPPNVLSSLVSWPKCY